MSVVLYITAASAHIVTAIQFSQTAKELQTVENVDEYYRYLQERLKIFPNDVEANTRLALLLLQTLQQQLQNIPLKRIRIKIVQDKVARITEHIVKEADTLKILNMQCAFYRSLGAMWQRLQQPMFRIEALNLAILQSKKALILYPYSSHFLFVHGQILDELGEVKKAQQFYKKALLCSDMVYPSAYGLSKEQKQMVILRLSE